MPRLDGTGPNGMGPMTGGGRGYCSPRGIRAGLPGNFPRRVVPDYYPRRAYGFGGFSSSPAREEELGFLKNEARSLGDELKALEARIQELEAKS